VWPNSFVCFQRFSMYVWLHSFSKLQLQTVHLVDTPHSLYNINTLYNTHTLYLTRTLYTTGGGPHSTHGSCRQSTRGHPAHPLQNAHTSQHAHCDLPHSYVFHVSGCMCDMTHFLNSFSKAADYWPEDTPHSLYNINTLYNTRTLYNTLGGPE